MGKGKSVVKPRREKLNAQLSLHVDGEEYMQDEILQVNNFEQERRQQIYDTTGEVCIERMIRIQDRTRRAKKLNPESDYNVTETKSKRSLFKSNSKRASVATFETSLQLQSKKELQTLRTVQS